MNAPERSIDLSVVVPCLNVEAVLPDQLKALAQQETTCGWEIVVVDNASSDSTIAVAQSFRSQIRELIIETEATRGRHHACNRGITVARSNRLVFVDADDRVEPGFVEAMRRALASAPIVAGALVHGSSTESEQRFGQVQTTKLMDGFRFLPYAAGGCVGFRREVFDSIGMFADDKPYCEDVDISWRAQLAGFSIAFEPAARVNVRQRQNLLAMYRQHRNFGEARVLLYRDYADRGMARRPLSEVAQDWRILATGWLGLRDRSTRARWVRRLGRVVGLLRGTFKYRRFYL